MDKREQAFILKEGNNMLTRYDFKLKYKQKTAYEVVNDLYKWLIETAKDTFNQLNGDNYEDFHEYYAQVINDLYKKDQSVADNKMLREFNVDSINRLTDIVKITKDEYRTIIDLPDEEKDFVYFNSLLGWYGAIPSETDMFIESLYTNQDEEEWLYNINSSNLYKSVIGQVVLQDNIDISNRILIDLKGDIYKNNNDYKRIAMVG